MRLIELKCPSCNSNLQANDETNRFFCGYCGSQILLDDEIKKSQVNVCGGFDFGYEQRRGQLQAEADYRAQLQAQERSRKQVMEARIRQQEEERRIRAEQTRAELNRVKPLIYVSRAILVFNIIYSTLSIFTVWAMIMIMLFENREAIVFNSVFSITILAVIVINFSTLVNRKAVLFGLISNVILLIQSIAMQVYLTNGYDNTYTVYMYILIFLTVCITFLAFVLVLLKYDYDSKK